MDAMRMLCKFPTGKRKFEMSWKFLYIFFMCFSSYLILLLATEMSDENMKRAPFRYGDVVGARPFDHCANLQKCILIICIHWMMFAYVRWSILKLADWKRIKDKLEIIIYSDRSWVGVEFSSFFHIFLGIFVVNFCRSELTSWPFCAT